jgi:hypothetical protein
VAGSASVLPEFLGERCDARGRGVEKSRDVGLGAQERPDVLLEVGVAAARLPQERRARFWRELPRRLEQFVDASLALWVHVFTVGYLRETSEPRVL